MQQLKIAIVASGLLVILEFYHFVRTHFSFEQYFHDSIAFTNYIRESNGNQNWLSLMRNRVETDPITNIRSWGCNLTESPVTFIHIGKSGGGTCRPKFQSLRNDYGYVNALYPFFYTDPNYTDSRRVIDCDAVTPLGNAIGCPVPMQLSTKSKLCSLESDTCHKSYVGHNFLGNEIHWLPPKILLSWWNTTFYFTKEETKRNATVIKRHLKSLIPPNIWCIDEKSSRPQNRKAYMKSYSSCVQPLQSMIDETSLKMFIDELKPSKHKSLGNMDWSPLYASLPVLRTTIIREPFSWLVSKFFWEVREEDHKPRCEEIDFATTHTQDGHFHFHNTVGDGWASRFALKYLFYLCGEGNDCSLRLNFFDYVSSYLRYLLLTCGGICIDFVVTILIVRLSQSIYERNIRNKGP